MTVSPWFLVWSNLFYLLPAAVLLYKSWHDKLRWNLELSFFISVGVVSAVHHLCDTPALGKCVQQKYSLYMLDLLFSYFAIAMTFGPFLEGTWRSVYHVFAIVGPVILLMVLGNHIAAAVVLLGIGLACFTVAQIKGWCRNWREHWELLPALCLFAAGVVFKVMSDRLQAWEYDYIWTHGLWHSMTALAAAVLFLDLPRLQPHAAYQELTEVMKPTRVGV